MSSSARVLDGVAIAAEIKAEVAAEVRELAKQGVVPGLAVILVGSVAASEIYVRSKVKTCGELGIYSEMLTPPESVTTEEMLKLVAELNAREDIDGILIQLPLPKHVDTKRLLEAVSPEKDVDGFHPVNVGRLQSGQPGLRPCTPAGIMEILRRRDLPVAGQNAVVVGRSDIVGKPAAMMLLNASATVTVCHSRTKDLAKFTRAADILVAAIGRPGFVTAEMVKPGAVLIDVGINRVTDAAEVERFFPGDAVRAATFAKRGSVVVGDVASGGVCGVGSVYAGSGRRGRADDCDADAEYADGSEGPARVECGGEGLAAMLRVGLTGSLGSGKSTAGRLFAAHGAYLLESDEMGREMMQPGQAVFADIVRHFGRAVVSGDGGLDRSALARIAFAKGRVEELNAIVHPAVIARQAEMTAEIARKDASAVVMVESALIFETKHGGGWRQRFDRMILVTAPEELKVARFVARAIGKCELSEAAREGLEAEARRRLAQQIDDQRKVSLADYVLTNNGPLVELKWQVDQLWPILVRDSAG